MAVHRFLTLEIKYSIMSTSLRDNLSLRGLSGVSRGKATCRSSVESAKFRYKCLASSVWTLARRELEPERLRCSCGDTFIQPEGVQLPLHCINEMNRSLPMKRSKLADEWLFVSIQETEQVVVVQWGCLLQIGRGKVIPSMIIGNELSLLVRI